MRSRCAAPRSSLDVTTHDHDASCGMAKASAAGGGMTALHLTRKLRLSAGRARASGGGVGTSALLSSHPENWCRPGL